MQFNNPFKQVTLCAALFLTPALLPAADQFDIVSVLSNTSSQTVWRITQPNVKQPTTPYAQIKFAPGDSISIDAGGCVQTGGHGNTWKRYVDPSGANSDRLYHGQIWIPGINASLVRVKDFTAFKVAKQIPSPLPASLNPADLYLRLGYEDDGYSDNGYYSHDDGTEGQCKNSVNAFVIVSVGHNGTLAPNPGQFVGIDPNNFRCQAAWAFHNFNTAELSNDSFNNAFNLSWYDYLDPTTGITFLAARGLASSGNCAGMSLLADVGEDQFITGPLLESFWANYRNTTNGIPASPVNTQINIAHWKQLSSTFLRGYIGSVFDAPSKTAASIERDLTKADYNYGLLALQHGTGGHVVVPLRVSHSGQQILIDVYDPNKPCGKIPDPNTYPPVIINGNNWSYDTGSGIWTGTSSGTLSFSGLAYIPYVSDSGWSDLGTNLEGLVKVIFGNDVNVDQVTDNTGKRLFLPNQPNVLDTSAQGLGNGLVRVPFLAAGPQKRPRTTGSKFLMNFASNLTPAMAKEVQQIQSEYVADYGGSGQIFVATSKQLSSLTFSVSGKKSGAPVRMLVGQKGQFYEVKSTAATASIVHPVILIQNLGRLADGVSVQSRDQSQMKVSIAHGLVSTQANNITIQKTAEVLVTNTPAKFSLASDNKLQLSSAATLPQVNVNTQVIDKNATVTNAPVRTMAVQKAIQ